MRLFRVLKDMKINTDLSIIFNRNVQHTIKEGSVLKLITEKNENRFIKCRFIYTIETYDYNFDVADLKTMIRMGYLEEISPNKSLILNEEKETGNMNLTTEDIYDKKHNIYDTMMLLEKMPKGTIVKNEYDENTWILSKNGKTLYSDGYFNIEDNYDLLDILYMTFTFVKPQEEKIEKWVEINNSRELCKAIANGKTIRFGNGEPIDKYNDKQIDTLFIALTHGLFKIEYLED